MDINITESNDAKLVHKLMLEAYDEEIVHKPNSINIKVVAMKKQLR